MEKRIGSLLIVIEDSQSVSKINEILSMHNQLILGRQGIPLRDKGISVISLVIEGTSDEFGSISGKLGRLNGVQVKSIMAKN
ncbi:MAG: iron-only hydrogenase system regulator [Bacteroidales bacterium]|nr:iron-only hydrogenase system regulator [Bacteroidales bacterium]MCF8390202.1 iron-only hydrogenase system regulator [Bacteroidales bacterium]